MTNGVCKNFIKNWFRKNGFKIDKSDCIFYFEKFKLKVHIHKGFSEQYGIGIFVIIDELHTDEERAAGYKWADFTANGHSKYGEREQWFLYLNHDEAYCEKFLQDIFDVYFKPFFDKGFEHVKDIAKNPNCFGYGKNHWWHVHPRAKEYLTSSELAFGPPKFKD